MVFSKGVTMKYTRLTMPDGFQISFETKEEYDAFNTGYIRGLKRILDMSVAPSIDDREDLINKAINRELCLIKH